MTNRTIARALLLSSALSTSLASPALAHDHESCSLALEHELKSEVRSLAERLFVAWRSKFPIGKRTEKLQILGINDFHGRLSTGLKVANRPVGGAAVLGAYLRSEEAAFDGTTLIVHAGDHVGATPPESALLQDEPSIQFLNLLANSRCSYWYGAHPRCNVVGTLGNHEFDEGVGELLRLIEGGKSPKGPFLETPYRGARFAYVSSNVIEEEWGEHLLPPYLIKQVGSERVGIIGAVLRETPSIVTPAGVKGIRFEDEIQSINRAVAQLKRRGVETIIVTIHQGGAQKNYTGSTASDAAAPSGRIVDIIQGLDSAVDVVISGHTHQFTNALVNNRAGHPILVTQAFSSGTAFGDIELTIDRSTHDVVEKSARIVTTFGDEGPGLAPAADIAELVAKAQAKVAPLVTRVIGRAATAITRQASAAGESALGNLIADAQRAAMKTQIAFMNPGGIRADLDAGEITWGELFTVQPFANDLVSMTLTGAQIRDVLTQQWSTPSVVRFLQVSGLTYRWDGALPVAERVTDIRVGGLPIDLSAAYSVAANSFLAGGGDGFVTLAQGQSRVVGPVDLEALVSYVQAMTQPVSARIEGRVTSP